VHVVKLMLERRLSGPFPRLGRIAVVAQAVAALAFVAVLLSAEGVRLPFTGSGDWTIEAAFTNVGGIHSGEDTPVLVSGVPAGTVTSVRVRDGLALVRMQLGPSARGVIRTNASATIEPRSALEDLTVDITSGSASAPAAPPGMVIPAARTSPTITLDQVISVLDADTRAQLSIMVDQLARGIGSHGGQLAAAVEQLRTLLDPATQIASALARRRQLLAELVTSLARIGASTEQHDLQIAQALRSGAVTLSVAARGQSSIAASVVALPATLQAVDSALRLTSSLATPLVPTLSGLRPTAAALPRALTSLRSAVPGASALLSAAEAFTRKGGPGLRAAAATMAKLGTTATALTPAIADFEPIVSAVNARRNGIAQLGERFSGVLSTDDANGPVLRGLGTFEPFNPADFGYPSATPAQTAKLAAQAAQALTLTCRQGQLVACLVRYLVPGLPGSVR
jgi:virulence factor Mce-like protein